MPYQHALVGDLLTSIDEHEVDPLLHTPAGQGVTWSRAKQSVAQVIESLSEQTLEGLQRAGKLGR